MSIFFDFSVKLKLLNLQTVTTSTQLLGIEQSLTVSGVQLHPDFPSVFSDWRRGYDSFPNFSKFMDISNFSVFVAYSQRYRLVYAHWVVDIGFSISRSTSFPNEFFCAGVISPDKEILRFSKLNWFISYTAYLRFISTDQEHFFIW